MFFTFPILVAPSSEEQARSLMRDQKDVKNETSGDILNNTGTMDYQQATGQLAVTFRNMALKRIRRAEKKGNEVSMAQHMVNMS